MTRLAVMCVGLFFWSVERCSAEVNGDPTFAAAIPPEIQAIIAVTHPIPPEIQSGNLAANERLVDSRVGFDSLSHLLLYPSTLPGAGILIHRQLLNGDRPEPPCLPTTSESVETSQHDSSFSPQAAINSTFAKSKEPAQVFWSGKLTPREKTDDSGILEASYRLPSAELASQGDEQYFGQRPQSIVSSEPSSRNAKDAKRNSSSRPDGLFRALDRNADLQISAEELADGAHALYVLDDDGDGLVSWFEAERKSSPPGGHPSNPWQRLMESPVPFSRPLNEVGGGRSPEPAPFGNQKDHSNWPEHRAGRDQVSHPINEGYVFINGVYLPPPYIVVQKREGALMINDQQVGEFDSKTIRRSERFQTPPRFQSIPGMGFGRLVQLLEAGALVSKFPDHSVRYFERVNGLSVIVDMITAPDRHSEKVRKSLKSLLPEAEISTWTRWILSYQPPKLLGDRLEVERLNVKRIVSETEGKLSASRWMNAMSYPLTLVGMGLVVWAAGHIMSFRPGSVGQSPHALAGKFTVISVILILSLSTLDLVWTLLASRSGSMQELNPIGSRLIENPTMLIGFKFTASAIAASLLIGLRNHLSAQRAAWWLCLVCALLTCRWLVFNSMYVT